MKKKNIVILILSLFIAIYALLQVIPYGKQNKDTPFKINPGDRPLVMAHGGAKLMNPENTWMAFDYAYELGVDVLEMDLQITKDGELITYHNNELEDFSNAEGLVSELTYDEIKQYNFGANFTDLDGNMPYASLSEEERLNYGDALVPASLEQMFQKYGPDMLYVCELKNEGELGRQSAEKMVELLIQYGMEDKVCVASFHKDTMEYFLSIAPEETVTSFDMRTATSFVVANYAGYGFFMNYDNNGLQLPMSHSGIPLDLDYLVYKIHKNNMFLHYWTINEIEDMKKCIELGADGIITDRPDLLIQLLDEMGY